jgi:hypothetical protein
MSLENWIRYLSICSGLVVDDWGRFCTEVRIGPASAYVTKSHIKYSMGYDGNVRTYDIICSRSLSCGSPFFFFRWYEPKEEPPCSWTERGRLVR